MAQPAQTQDPRGLRDFDASHLPLCDGGPLPAEGTRDANLMRAIEFAAIYYEMNRALAAAEKARIASDEPSEREALLALRKASDSRDALEDRCIAVGFIAEPSMEGQRYTDLRFTWAGKPPPPPVFVQRYEAEIDLGL